MLTNKFHNQLGVSLIELMVGIAVSLILITGVLTLSLRMTVSGGESIRATRLNQELRGGLDLIVKDLQRAGYVNWFEAWDSDGDTVLDDINGDTEINILDFYESAVPVINAFGNIQLFSFPTSGDATSGTPIACTTNCDCVLYSYDIDSNGGLSTGQFELFGFRWNDGAIEMRTGGNPNSCTAGTWQDITDSNVTVTNLSFSMVYANAVGTGNDSTVYSITGGSASGPSNTCTPVDSDATDPIINDGDTVCLWRRKVDITLQGQLADDANVSISLNTDVKLKNDFFNSAP